MWATRTDRTRPTEARGRSSGPSPAVTTTPSRTVCKQGVANILGLYPSCTHEVGPGRLASDRSGRSTWANDSGGLGRTARPRLRIRRLGVRVPPSAPAADDESEQVKGPAPNTGGAFVVGSYGPFGDVDSNIYSNAAARCASRGWWAVSRGEIRKWRQLTPEASTVDLRRTYDRLFNLCHVRKRSLSSEVTPSRRSGTVE
jgi:hypothetical protein